MLLRWWPTRGRHPPKCPTERKSESASDPTRVSPPSGLEVFLPLEAVKTEVFLPPHYTNTLLLLRRKKNLNTNNPPAGEGMVFPFTEQEKEKKQAGEDMGSTCIPKIFTTMPCLRKPSTVRLKRARWNREIVEDFAGGALASTPCG